MKKWISLLALSLATALPQVAMSHGAQPKHGGIVQSSNDITFELVTVGASPVIYVDDHGKPVSTAGATGKLTVLNGSEKTEVTLQPGRDNTLKAKGDARLRAGSKAVATITFADKKTMTVRFSLK